MTEFYINEDVSCMFIYRSLFEPNCLLAVIDANQIESNSLLKQIFSQFPIC